MKKLVTLTLVTFGLLSCTREAHQTALEIPVPVVGKETLTAASYSLDASTRCPKGMAFVDGEYCPEVEQVCLRWVDATGVPTEPPVPPMTGRCGEWRYPSRCKTATVHKSFCIDVYEYPNVAGVKPQSWMTWRDVKRACEGQGKRLCTRSEWTFSCEGPEMKPYPYGDGYHRDRTSCNTDNPVPKDVDVFKSTAPHDAMSQKLDAMLVPAGSMPNCVSPFGVYDMVGNIDEQIVNESGRPYASGLMSGHVFGVRNACRPMTDAHNEDFGWYETGGRCCGDVR